MKEKLLERIGIEKVESPLEERNKIVKYLPIILIEVFYIICYVLFRFGVWKWPTASDNKVLLFITGVGAATLIGYILAEKICVRNSTNGRKYFSIDINVIVAVCCVVGLVMYVPTSLLYTNSIIPPFWSAFSNLGDMYRQYALSQYASSGLRWWGIFDVFVYAIFPLTYYYFDKLHRVWKIFGSILSAGYLMIYACSGKNLPVFVFLIANVVVAFLMVCSSAIKKKKKIFVVIFSLLITVGTVYLFSHSMASRTFYTAEVAEGIEEEVKEGSKKEEKKEPEIEKEESEKEKETSNSKYKKVKKLFPGYVEDYSKAYVDLEDSILNAIPKQVEFLYVIGTKYLSNGFHGLSVAMDMEHEWTYGLGRTPFLRTCAQKFLGLKLQEKTYYSRMEDLKPQTVNPHGWMTAFTDLANDFTFPGVVVVMGMLGALLGVLFNDALRGKNPFAILLLSYLTMQLLYMPAGWIIEFSGGMAVQFYILLISWGATKVYERIGK